MAFQKVDSGRTTTDEKGIIHKVSDIYLTVNPPQTGDSNQKPSRAEVVYGKQGFTAEGASFKIKLVGVDDDSISVPTVLVEDLAWDSLRYVDAEQGIEIPFTRGQARSLHLGSTGEGAKIDIAANKLYASVVGAKLGAQVPMSPNFNWLTIDGGHGAHASIVGSHIEVAGNGKPVVISANGVL